MVILPKEAALPTQAELRERRLRDLIRRRGLPVALFINVGSGAMNVGQRPRRESIIVSLDGWSGANRLLN
jgi:hypothetical protein